MAVIKSIFKYSCEAWTTTSITERKLKAFENKIWIIINGPIYESKKDIWKNNNKELLEDLKIASKIIFIKG